MILHGLNNKDIDNNAEVGEAAKRIVASSKSMTQLTERLKGQNYVDPNDPMLIAENELLSAAQSIELAAKRLAELKPRQEVKGQVNQLTIVNVTKKTSFTFCIFCSDGDR